MKTRHQFIFIFIFSVFLLGNAGHFMLPQVFTSSQGRTFSGTTKAHLHNMYLVCNEFWAVEGDSKICTVSIATQKEYRFFQSQDVKIYGSGTKNDFFAVAWHLGNNILHDIDSRGVINEQTDVLKNMLNKNPPGKIWIYEKLFPRHLFYYSIIWILLVATIILTIWAGDSSILRKKKLKKSGKYLYGVIGVLLAVNIAYVFMYEYYEIDYKNQSVKFSKEIESVIQTDPSWLQRMYEVH